METSFSRGKLVERSKSNDDLSNPARDTSFRRELLSFSLRVAHVAADDINEPSVVRVGERSDTQKRNR